VEIAMELHALAEQLLKQRLRRERPRISDARIEQEVNRWRSERPGAQYGDGPGRVVAWPRRHRR
jgi:hypothetical protein